MHCKIGSDEYLFLTNCVNIILEIFDIDKINSRFMIQLSYWFKIHMMIRYTKYFFIQDSCDDTMHSLLLDSRFCTIYFLIQDSSYDTMYNLLLDSRFMLWYEVQLTSSWLTLRRFLCKQEGICFVKDDENG